MIDPLRFRSLEDHQTFDENDSPVQCWQCQQDNISTPAFFFCHECGKVNSARAFCQECFFDYHTRKKGKEGHTPHPIVRGDPVIVQTLADGDGTTFAKMHEWITLDYTLTTDESDDIIEDTFSTKQPLIFQSGCSGPCVHLQLLGCTDIAAADILGSSDPYCAVYWNNGLAGVTTTKHMTLNPVWVNQTFVLPLAEDFMAALDDGNSSALFNAGALLPKLHIDLYDWDRLSKNDFLGQASISDADIIRILRAARNGEVEEGQLLSFTLMPKQSRGKLGIRVAVRGKKLFVHVVRGENLPKADPYSLSDPYCEVYWNDKKMGKTVHIDDTLDPVWDLEIFVIKVDVEGPNSIDQSTLRLECLDWDQFGSDDVLGQIELKGWQIRELAESNGEDGAMGGEDGSGAMGEADMEKIYDFIQTFQKRNVEEGGEGMGKMIVGVPQDPKIQTGVADVPREEGVTSAGTAAEVAREPRKKIQKKDKRKHEGGVEPGGQGDRDDGIDISEEKQGPAEEDPGGDDTTATAEADKTDTRVRQGEVVEIVVPKEIEPDGGRQGAERQQGYGEENYVGAHVYGIEAGPVGLKQELTEGGKEQGEAVRDGVGLIEIEQSIGGDATRPEAPVAGMAKFESDTDGGVQPARDKSKEEAAGFLPGADVEGGGGGVTEARAEATAETKIEDSGDPSVAVTYRDASVERFEEDRGILVKYVDDKSTAWVATKLIPRLVVRDDVPVARNIFQRLWSQRNKVFNFHKRVLNVKRGLKVLLELAMTGCRMQWYPLQLTDEQSGANFVRGSVNLRFLFHTRGSVLRGLDVAVSHMSLGERARVEVRSDYGFGEVYAARKVPPYATLVFVAQVAAVGHRNARWVLFRRAMRDAIEDRLFRARSWLSRFVVSTRLVGLLGAIRRTKHDDTAMLGTQRLENEDEQHGGAIEAVEDGPQSGNETGDNKRPEGGTTAPEQRGGVIVTNSNRNGKGAANEESVNAVEGQQEERTIDYHSSSGLPGFGQG